MTPMLRQNLTLCVLVLIGINMRPLLIRREINTQ